MRRPTPLLLAILLLLPITSHAQTDPLAPLSFLIGTWTPAGIQGSTTFVRDLGGRVIIRRSRSLTPASGIQPAAQHEDLLIIFPYGNQLRAMYYDNAGYVLGYDVQAPGNDSVVFTSDRIKGVARGRLTYTLEPGDVLAATVEMAPPNRPNAFAPSLAWSSHRAK